MSILERIETLELLCRNGEVTRLVLVFMLLIASPSCSQSDMGSEPCYEVFEGQKAFMRSYDCISEGDLVRIDGYWEVGLEHSIFYEDLSALNSGNVKQAYWLNPDRDTLAKHSKSILSPEYQIFSIEGVGWKSEEEGFYSLGHSNLEGQRNIKGGIAIKYLSKVEELPLGLR